MKNGEALQGVGILHDTITEKGIFLGDVAEFIFHNFVQHSQEMAVEFLIEVVLLMFFFQFVPKYLTALERRGTIKKKRRGIEAARNEYYFI